MHLNPGQVDAVRRRPLEARLEWLRGFTWSSYQTCAGRYRRQVEAGGAEADEEFAEVWKQSPRSMGGEAFREWVDRRHEAGSPGGRVVEEVSYRRTTNALNPGEVMNEVAREYDMSLDELRRRRNSVLRAVASSYLVHNAGLSQREVASRWCMDSGSSVSKQISARKRAEEQHENLRGKLARLETVRSVRQKADCEKRNAYLKG